MTNTAVIIGSLLIYLVGIGLYSSWLKSEGIHYAYDGCEGDPKFIARTLVWPWMLLLRLIWIVYKSIYYLGYVLFYHSFKVVFKGEV